ncbi:uncharacterized protein MELLADRAFT_101079 [Melampsora larici-populina 98AG31]|uniref:Protein kinase domain-containing protein n=1 Tax=Melampsora larici-populina (strain 98AG31 / pathotype 3-4-7) TaxID=747676 RepID=F4R3J8_MELLP|nr:uncharacterized protein MELLADRAFT_101079 [Melampsora larici-populina 98AG31]EGG12640.1 hypothetical protein MELLADRAFT_101079 [Melampsora larici-populina 98AG31]
MISSNLKPSQGSKPQEDIKKNQAIESEKQKHLNTINLLTKLEKGESIDNPQLATELLEDPLDFFLSHTMHLNISVVEIHSSMTRRYVRWALDTYSAEEVNGKEQLLPILEQSTRKFVNDVKYRHDLRYLKLWALYARQCSRLGATKIYEYLSRNEIGIRYSMFYEEWANAIEAAFGDLKRVERVYDLGIQCDAQPINRLQKRKKALAKKMAESSAPLSQPSENKSQQGVPPHESLVAHVLFNDPLKEYSTPTIPSATETAPVPSSKAEASTSISQVFSCNLSHLYPKPDVEISPEELRAHNRYPSYLQADEPWQQEPFETGKWYSYHSDGSPILYQPTTGEPLFDYLKNDSSCSSEMQLSDDEIQTPMIPTYQTSSSRKSSDVHEAQTSPDGDSHMLSQTTSSSSFDTFDDDSASEAIADAEVSLKMDSPPRQSTTAYIKSRKSRASVTMTTQAALNDVLNMYGPEKDSDESDDNTSDADEDLRDQFTCDTDFTVTALKDATADVTYWSQPMKSDSDEIQSDHMPNTSNSFSQRPVDGENSCCEDENGRPMRPYEDTSTKASHNPSGSGGSFTIGQRSTPAFKPVRKPLATLTPVYDENALPSGPPVASSSKGLGVKRIPLGEKSLVTPSIGNGSWSQPNFAATSMMGSGHDYAPNFVPDSYKTPSDERDQDQFFPEEIEEPMCDEQEPEEYDDLVEMADFDQDRGHGFCPLRYIPVGDNFNALTPITERTNECTSTIARSIAGRSDRLRMSMESNLGPDRYSQVGSDNEESELTPRANDHLCMSGGSLHQPMRERLEFNIRQPDDMQIDVNSSDHFMTSPSQRRPFTSPRSLMNDQQSHHPSLHNNQGHHYAQRSENDRPEPMDSIDHLMRNQALNSPPMDDNLDISQTSEMMQAGEPCNPYAEEILSVLLEGLDPPLSAYPGFRSLSNYRANKLAELQHHCKVRPRKQSHGGGSLEEAKWEIELDGDTYFIYEKLGEGAYGSVFKVIESNDGETTTAYENGVVYKAMKVENPPNLYEFSILSQLHKILSPRLCTSLILPHKLYAYSDESFLILDYSDQGTLLDIVNRAGEMGISPTNGGAAKGIDELLAMFFIIELIRVIEGLHEAGFIHGDLKIDNCLVRLQSVPGGSKSWSSIYNSNGQNGWEFKGLRLIDYGRSIDTNVFPNQQEFIVEWETDEYDCPEMRLGKSWSFQPDYYGILSISFCLLFGTFMNEKDSIKPPFKRYHQIELWSKLFKVCLNPNRLPNLLDLKTCRLEMENWLSENCERNGKSLKSFLKKIELASLSR